MTDKKSTKKPAKKSPVKKAAKKVVSKAKKAVNKVVDAFTPEVKTMNGVNVTETNAAEYHVSHAETVQAVEHENKDVVTEIKHDGSALGIARRAWHEIKDSGDPEFDNCVPPHRDKLMSHAEGILKGGSPMVGDTILARFEQVVSRLK